MASLASKLTFHYPCPIEGCSFNLTGSIELDHNREVTIERDGEAFVHIPMKTEITWWPVSLDHLVKHGAQFS